MNNMNSTNKDMFTFEPAQHPPENPYHKRLREFAKGNVTKEYQKGEFKMVHFRLPLYVYRELKRRADERCIPVGRFTIELLRSWADKEIQKQEQRRKELLESLDGFEDLTVEDFK